MFLEDESVERDHYHHMAMMMMMMNPRSYGKNSYNFFLFLSLSPLFYFFQLACDDIRTISRNWTLPTCAYLCLLTLGVCVRVCMRVVIRLIARHL